jgi:hypothetical protein
MPQQSVAQSESAWTPIWSPLLPRCTFRVLLTAHGIQFADSAPSPTSASEGRQHSVTVIGCKTRPLRESGISPRLFRSAWLTQRKTFRVHSSRRATTHGLARTRNQSTATPCDIATCRSGKPISHVLCASPLVRQRLLFWVLAACFGSFHANAETTSWAHGVLEAMCAYARYSRSRACGPDRTQSMQGGTPNHGARRWLPRPGCATHLQGGNFGPIAPRGSPPRKHATDADLFLAFRFVGTPGMDPFQIRGATAVVSNDGGFNQALSRRSMVACRTCTGKKELRLLQAGKVGCLCRALRCPARHMNADLNFQA